MQFDPFEPEFNADWSGLEWVNFCAEPAINPSEADLQEIDLWRPDMVDKPCRPQNRRKYPFDFQHCYALAELGFHAAEVIKIMGCSKDTLFNNLRSRFGMTWSEYRDIATTKLRSEMKIKVIDKIRKGDDRMLTMYASKVFWNETKKVEITGKNGKPIETKSVTIHLTLEELQKRRQELTTIVDRPPRFLEEGQLSPTLEIGIAADAAT